MKSIARPSLLFSSYPLKAVKDPAAASKEPGSPYLKALLSGKAKTVSRGRVFPMTNHYNKQYKPVQFDNNKLPKDIELTEKAWFNNYE